ncbi:MAG: tyrosine-protein phosphatase [Bdellovibrionota bacterium]
MKLAAFTVLSFCLNFVSVSTAHAFERNLHTVEKGKLYRSGQLSGSTLESVIKKHGIKTVINLRGYNPTQDWFKAEEKVANKTGTKLVSISMNSKRLPHREDLLTLLDTFATAPRPILVHCEGGSDRTGEAAAIYQMLYMGKTKKDALKMLTAKYLHFTWLKPAKSYFIKNVWQGEEWARESYDPCSGGYEYYDVNNSAC